jgi:hypothetical protein
MELGFRDLHLEFRHSRLPRSKPVERVIGALQYLMEGECGYVGRDEKKERFERIQKLMLDVRAGRASADKVLYSADQWRARLKEICSAYNAEVQNGKMTRGLSPEEAFLQFNPPGNPPVKYDARCRYLLSTHKKPVKVTPSGIVLPKTWFDDPFDGRLYANKATSHLVGQRVLVWFNPDTPELITVTDMNRKNPICVERNLADAMDESRESLAELKARCNGHNSFARERYTVLKLRHPQTIRPNRVSEADAELGRRINEFEAAAKEQRTQRQRRVTRANRAARSLDHYRPEGIEDRPEAVEALERLSRTLNEPDSEESEVRQ